MTARAAADDETPLPEREATAFLVACPFPSCDQRLGAAGLTYDHLVIHYREDGRRVVLSAFVLTWRLCARIIRLGAASDEARCSSLASDILNALVADPDHVMTLAEIAAAVGQRPENCRTALLKLERCGAVVRTRKGQYRLLAGARPPVTP